jgi:probable F420-dependent oxidoreductase
MAAGGPRGTGLNRAPTGSPEGAPVRVDLWIPTATPLATPELLEVIATEADQRGVGTLWVGEHVVLFDEYDSVYPYADDGRIPAPPGTGLLEPLTTLTFLAAHSERVRLGTAMLLLPQRNPVYVAKEVATLDWLAGGRVDLGVGVGWLREEFDAVNAPWPARGRRTDEYLEVLHTLWCDEISEYRGETYTLAPCRLDPKPVQSPHPPIHIGGETPAALRRAARSGQGWHTFNRTPDELAAPLADLDRLLEGQGRTRSDLTITVCPYFRPLDADTCARYAEAGADAVAALLLPFGVDETRAALDALQPVFDRAASL